MSHAAYVLPDVMSLMWNDLALCFSCLEIYTLISSVWFCFKLSEEGGVIASASNSLATAQAYYGLLAPTAVAAGRCVNTL